MTKIDSIKAMGDLVKVVKVWNLLDGTNDLHLQSFVLQRNSFHIEAEATFFDTVRIVFKTLRNAGALIKGKPYHLKQRQSNRRRRGCVTIPLAHDGKMTIYAKNDCFGEDKKSNIYAGYTGAPDCNDLS